jgi:L-seryl-tRNA(Ser) seleniumtransferase
VIDDIGSGAVINFDKYGLLNEPVAADSIRAGADLVLFSGDKLLGGPQAGIIVGRKHLIDQIERHPLTRALRVGKMTLAALSATLRLYQQAEGPESSIPLLSMLATSLQNLQHRAEKVAVQVRSGALVRSAEAVEGTTFLGGGAIPGQQLSTWCVAIVPEGMGVNELADRLRCGHPAVYGRVHQDRLLLDLRSVRPAEDRLLVQALIGQGEPETETATADV